MSGGVVGTPDLYRTLRPVARGLARLGARVRLEGVDNVPAEGPFLLLSNHQSAVDPIFAQGWCPREVHAMTKSTQFRHPVFRWLIPRLRGFPTRRYRVDPQAVRVALRLLDAGKGVGVYAEGERTWHGLIQPFRRGTVRLALRAGVPVVPCGISGTYDLWPRWARRPRRAKVTVRYGEPIVWEAHRNRTARERRLPEATRELESAVAALVDQPESVSPEELRTLLDVDAADPARGTNRIGGSEDPDPESRGAAPGSADEDEAVQEIRDPRGS